MSNKRIVTVDVGCRHIRVACWDLTRPLPRLLDYRSHAIAAHPEHDDIQTKRLKVQAQLARLVEEMGLKKCEAVGTVRGVGVLLRYIHVPPVPPWKLKLLMRYEIVEGSQEDIDNVANDFRVLDLPAAQGRELTILLGLAKKDIAEDEQFLLQGAGLKVRDLTISPVALYETMVFPHRHDLPDVDPPLRMAVDLGHDAMQVAIYRGTDLYFLRTIQPGGRRFLESLAGDMEIDEPEAEKILYEKGEMLPWDASAMDPGDPDASEASVISEALERAAGELSAMLQSALSYAKTQLRLPDLALHEIMLTGGAANIKGLDAFLSRRMEYPVRMIDPLAEVDCAALDPPMREKVAREAWQMTTCIGLALNQAVSRRCAMSLMSPALKKRRHFMANALYSWISAAVAVMAMVLWTATALWFQSLRQNHLARQENGLKVAQQKQEEFDTLYFRHNRLHDQFVVLDAYLRSSGVVLDTLATLRDMTPRKLFLEHLATEIDPAGNVTVIAIKGKITAARTTSEAQEMVREFADALQEKSAVLRTHILENPTHDSQDFSLKIYVSEEKGHA